MRSFKRFIAWACRVMARDLADPNVSDARVLAWGCVFVAGLALAFWLGWILEGLVYADHW